ncbi:hypothetical protein HHI36_007416 [Cryptolaemus montrouzieri]|uniref:27 kDa hemolymph protein n=1 Tax=Cryptolaemus montrouzieri TaxID=559131 RepID=A0ABD2MPQ9_9CUCU
MELQLVLAFAFIFAGVTSQISNELGIDVDDIKKQLGEELPGVDLSGTDQVNSSQIDELELIFRNKCDSKSGNGTYDTIKASKDVYQECISNFVNVTQLKLEVDDAKKTGSMDEVFGKYCDKYPALTNCSSDFVEALQPCLEEHESKSLNISIGLAHKLKDFICYKSGDRIAMFVAEGGVDCINSQKEVLKQCLNSTLSSRVPSDMSPNSLPILMFNSDDCRDFAKLRTCIVDALSHCPETTPSNLVDAFSNT